MPNSLDMANSPSPNTVVYADNLDYLRTMPDGVVDLIYIDPPFNTGKTQSRESIRTVRDDESGDRTGFQGRRYRTERVGSSAFGDQFDDYLAFLEPRLVEAERVLKPNGSFFLHVDYREVHYCKVLLDEIFGRDSFINEIVWAYDYGARSKSRWSAKHDNILWYVKDPSNFTFNHDEMDRIPYMAPGLVGPEKAARGKTPTDVWWHTIVPRTARRKPATPPKNRSASSNASSRSTPTLMTSFWTSSQAAARQAKPPQTRPPLHHGRQ